MNHRHFLLVSLPGQGHINPTLQLAKKLARAGALVTFATTVHGLRNMNTLLTLDRLSYASFSDGYDDDESRSNAVHVDLMDALKRVGSQTLTNLIHTLSNEGHPVTFLIYTVLLPWAAKVARDMHVPSAFLSIQSATTFVIYHRFFNTRDGIYDGTNVIDPLISINLPGLPLFTSHDLPTFLLPTSPHYSFMIPIIQEHIQNLEKDPNPCVLVNSFDSLEEISIKSICNMSIFSIGPLVPSAFSDQNDASDTSFGCDLFQSSTGYFQWLESKPNRSVVYVSFGSFVVLEKRQKEEILQGLVESGRSFLWVLRDSDGEEAIKGEIGNGLIVGWCSQMEVLCHRSIGCFVAHCGWNSTVESVVGGVPVVGCPHFSDQTTNAKMVEEVWGNGVRGRVNEEGVVGKEEIKRCLDIVMGDGERGEEIRSNALKWKTLAVEAVREGGSSCNNLKQLLER